MFKTQTCAGWWGTLSGAHLTTAWWSEGLPLDSQVKLMVALTGALLSTSCSSYLEAVWRQTFSRPARSSLTGGEGGVGGGGGGGGE